MDFASDQFIVLIIRYAMASRRRQGLRIHEERMENAGHFGLPLAFSLLWTKAYPRQVPNLSQNTL